VPRIYDSQSNPLDFCKACFPSARDAFEQYGNVGDGPDGRGNCYGYNDEHPPYEDEDYTCENCRRLLRARDN
jgi:hypothetical protein